MKRYYSDFNVTEKSQFNLVNVSYNGFLDLEIDFSEKETIEVEIKNENYAVLSEKENLSLYDKYIILTNLIDVIIYKPTILDFDLNMENIYINSALNPKIYMRHLTNEQQDYMHMLKSLCISMLCEKTYEEVKSSNIEDYIKVIDLTEVKDFEQLRTLLNTKIVEYQEDLEKTKVEINKKVYKVVKNTALAKIIIIILLIIMLAFGYIYFYTFSVALNNGYSAYVEQDYNLVVKNLNGYMNTNRLTKEQKVIVAKAIIYSEPLETTQVDYLTNNITKDSINEVFLYWLAIASNNYKEALDHAKVLENLDLQIYGAGQWLNYLETDTSMSSADKAALVSDVSGEVNGFLDKKEEGLDETE